MKEVSLYCNLLCLYSYVVFRSDNFIVGLTNVHPLDSTPTLFNYTLCGQYPGAVPAAATVSLYCQDNLPPFRYVIVQFPSTDGYMNVCEIEVLVIGTRLSVSWWCLSVVVSTLALFNEVNRHWARLVLGLVTVYGQVNHLGIWPATHVDSAMYPLLDGKMSISFRAE